MVMIMVMNDPLPSPLFNVNRPSHSEIQLFSCYVSHKESHGGGKSLGQTFWRGWILVTSKHAIITCLSGGIWIWSTALFAIKNSLKWILFWNKAESTLGADTNYPFRVMDVTCWFNETERTLCFDWRQHQYCNIHINQLHSHNFLAVCILILNKKKCCVRKIMLHWCR